MSFYSLLGLIAFLLVFGCHAQVDTAMAPAQDVFQFGSGDKSQSDWARDAFGEMQNMIQIAMEQLSPLAQGEVGPSPLTGIALKVLFGFQLEPVSGIESEPGSASLFEEQALSGNRIKYQTGEAGIIVSVVSRMYDMFNNPDSKGKFFMTCSDEFLRVMQANDDLPAPMLAPGKKKVKDYFSQQQLDDYWILYADIPGSPCWLPLLKAAFPVVGVLNGQQFPFPIVREPTGGRPSACALQDASSAAGRIFIAPGSMIMGPSHGDNENPPPRGLAILCSSFWELSEQYIPLLPEGQKAGTDLRALMPLWMTFYGQLVRFIKVRGMMNQPFYERIDPGSSTKYPVEPGVKKGWRRLHGRVASSLAACKNLVAYEETEPVVSANPKRLAENLPRLLALNNDWNHIWLHFVVFLQVHTTSVWAFDTKNEMPGYSSSQAAKVGKMTQPRPYLDHKKSGEVAANPSEPLDPNLEQGQTEQQPGQGLQDPKVPGEGDAAYNAGNSKTVDDLFIVDYRKEGPAGTCTELQNKNIAGAFREMQGMIKEAEKELKNMMHDDSHGTFTFATDLVLGSLFDFRHAAPSREERTFKSAKLKQIRQWALEMYDILHNLDNKVKARVFCKDDFMALYHADSDLPASLVKPGKTKVKDYLSQKKLDENWILFADIAGSPTFLFLEKDLFPGKYEFEDRPSPFPVPEGKAKPSICAAAGDDIHGITWRSDALYRLNKEDNEGSPLPAIILLCPQSWTQNKDQPSTIPPPNWHADGSMRVADQAPWWMDLYQELFWLTPLENEKQALPPYRIKGLGKKPINELDFHNKAGWAEMTDQQTRDWDQCLSLAAYDRARPAVNAPNDPKKANKLLRELKSLNNIRNHMWLHFVTCLQLRTRRVWALGQQNDFSGPNADLLLDLLLEGWQGRKAAQRVAQESAQELREDTRQELRELGQRLRKPKVRFDDELGEELGEQLGEELIEEMEGNSRGQSEEERMDELKERLRKQSEEVRKELGGFSEAEYEKGKRVFEIMGEALRKVLEAELGPELGGEGGTVLAKELNKYFPGLYDPGLFDKNAD